MKWPGTPTPEAAASAPSIAPISTPKLWPACIPESAGPADARPPARSPGRSWTRTAPASDALDAVAAAGHRSGLVVRPGPEGLELQPAGGGVDAALARLLAIVVIAQTDGTWARLKACPGRDCQWALYDRTRSRTRTWCAAAKRGARTRTRAYRARRADE